MSALEGGPQWEGRMRPGADIHMTKRLRVVVTLCIAAAFAAGGIWFAREMLIDRCLDRGGSWDYNQARCDMATN